MNLPRKKLLLDEEQREILEQRQAAYEEEQLMLDGHGSDNTTEKLLQKFPGFLNRQIT